MSSFGRVLLGVGHEDVPADVLDPERRVVFGKIPGRRMPLGANPLERPVEHVNAAVVEVGGVEQVARSRRAMARPL